MKKTLLILFALIISAGFAFAQKTIAPSSNVPGVKVYDKAAGDGFSGANIIMGTDFSEWPWTSGPEAAFTPVKGGAYTMTFNFEATGTMNGMRVRWITNDSYGTDQGSPLVEGMWGEGEGGPGRFTVSAEDGTVADGLSAYFTDGSGSIAGGSVLTYTVNFTMDDVEAFQNIGSIGIRGGSGSHDFVINTIVITDAKGNMLVNFDKDALVVLPPSNDVPGVYIWAKANDDSWSGANIILGNDATAWPWSTAGEDDAVAFTPVKGKTYNMTFNVTSTGATAYRVRWIKDNTNGGYTTQDGVEVGNHPFDADETGDFVPAYFNSGIANGDTKTISLDFTLDGSEPADGLIGNLAIRGGGGSNDFFINTIVITDAKGNMLVNFDKDAESEVEPECAVIFDFSEMTREDNNASQLGWKQAHTVMEEIAEAKYFVIETEGVGDNDEGFGTLQFIVQGGGDGVGLSWTQFDVTDEWQAFPRAEGKTVSIAIDIKNVLGSKYDTFLQCVWWGQMFVGYYGGASAADGLGFKNAYLTYGFAKPDGAVDLAGGEDWGFVFEGSVACSGSGGEESGNISFDFEKDAIGDTYAVYRFDSATGETSSVDVPATVVENPAATDDNALSLSYKITAYDQVILLGKVVIPDGLTLADCAEVSFDVYTNGTEYKEIVMRINDEPLWGNGIYKKISPGGSWATLSVNPTTGETTDADGNVTGKSGSKGGTSVYTDGSLTSFDFCLGINDNALSYYLDNVVFNFKSETGIIQVKPVLTQVFNAPGGIIVNANNEKVSIYGIDGRLMKQGVAGYGTIISLHQGIYIVKVGAAAPVKVLVK